LPHEKIFLKMNDFELLCHKEMRQPCNREAWNPATPNRLKPGAGWLILTTIN